MPGTQASGLSRGARIHSWSPRGLCIERPLWSVPNLGSRGRNREGPGASSLRRPPGGRPLPSLGPRWSADPRGRGPGLSSSRLAAARCPTSRAPRRPAQHPGAPGPLHFSLYHKYINYANYGHCILTKPETSPARPLPLGANPSPPRTPLLTGARARAAFALGARRPPIRDSSHSPGRGAGGRGRGGHRL